MTIRILSFDFDGCLFNRAYHLRARKDVIQDNKTFLDKIKEENKKFNSVTTFIGSNRQSLDVEFINIMRGSAFTTVQDINNYLETTLDTFLLADIYGDLPAGTSYDKGLSAVKALKESKYSGLEKHSHWLFDETKTTILYAQMHKIANENPQEEIVFDFFDDREDILEALKNFYDTNQELIPNNITLRLHQYTGDDPKLISEIKGSGFIDSNFRQTVKDMANQAVNEHEDGINQAINVAKKVNVELLLNRKPLSQDNAAVADLQACPIPENVAAEALREPAAVANSGFETFDEGPSPRANLLPRFNVDLEMEEKSLRNAFQDDASRLMWDARFRPRENPVFNPSMQILSGFIAAMGIATIAVAFAALNAATLGTVGIAVAAIGAASTIIGGIGLFRYAPTPRVEEEPVDGFALD